MAKDNILVIGGYGKVGQTICNILGQEHPGKVIAAGRSLKKAVTFCDTTEGRVRPLQLDITAPLDPVLLENTSVVVMCLDQNDMHVVEHCAKTGTHYIDITASFQLLSQIASRDAMFRESGATALMSIGLAPGITNLMVSEAHGHIGHHEQSDISIMLGLGEAHGQAAMDWTVAGMNESYTVIEQGNSRAVESFTEGKVVDFGGRWGKRKAYRFNFCDQHVLPHTLSIPTVSTRLCLDSRWITVMLAVFKKLGGMRLLKYRSVSNTVIAMMGWFAGGKPQFSVKVDSWGYQAGDTSKRVHIEQFLHGLREAEITAIVAASVIESVYHGNKPHGAYHIEQLFTLHDLLSTIGSKVDYTMKYTN
ncbi:Saccharopine dehydrogenase [compost metagenome]